MAEFLNKEDHKEFTTEEARILQQSVPEIHRAQESIRTYISAFYSVSIALNGGAIIAIPAFIEALDIQVAGRELLTVSIFISLINGLILAAAAIFISYTNSRAIRTVSDRHATIRLADLRRSFGLDVDEQLIKSYKMDREKAKRQTDKTAKAGPVVAIMSLISFAIGATCFVFLVL